jgi:hypothetical protein
MSVVLVQILVFFIMKVMYMDDELCCIYEEMGCVLDTTAPFTT